MFPPPPRFTLFPYNDALPISFVLASYLLPGIVPSSFPQREVRTKPGSVHVTGVNGPLMARRRERSEEHTSELQSRQYLVCRLLLEKKNKKHKDRLLASIDATQ